MKKVLVSILFLAAVLSLSHPAASQAGSNSLNDQLLLAAEDGDTAAVQQLLDKGANIEATDKLGRTALIKAAIVGKTEVIKLLLDKGANIEAKDQDGTTALGWAKVFAWDETAKLLREHGAH